MFRRTLLPPSSGCFLLYLPKFSQNGSRNVARMLNKGVVECRPRIYLQKMEAVRSSYRITIWRHNQEDLHWIFTAAKILHVALRKELTLWCIATVPRQDDLVFILQTLFFVLSVSSFQDQKGSKEKTFWARYITLNY